MRIGLDTNSVLGNRGGASTYFLELLPEMLTCATEDDELIVLHGEQDDAQPLAWLLRDQRLKEMSAPFGSRRSNGLWRMLAFPAIERFVPEGDSQAAGLDVCHSLASPLMPSRAETRVLTLHTFQPTQTGRLTAPLRRSLQAADRVICTSNQLCSQVEQAVGATPKCDGLEHKLTVIKPGVHDRFRDAPKASAVEVLFQRFPFLEERYLLVPDLSAQHEAILLLLQAWSRAQTVESELAPLVMCADAEASFGVMDLLRREGFEGRLLLIEEPEVELLPALYRGAECVLSPSQQFDYSIPVLEAAAAGIPGVVGAQCGALEDLGSALMVPEDDDPDSWAASLVRMHQMGDARRNRGAEGQQRVAAVTWQKTAQAHWRIYRGLMTGEIKIPSDLL